MQPHLERLKQAMKSAHRRNELAANIQTLRQRLVDAEAHEIEVSGEHISGKKYALTALAAELRHDEVRLQSDIATIRGQAQAQIETQAKALAELAILESERDSLSVAIAEHQIQLAEYLSNETTLKAETKRLDVLRSGLKKLEAKLADYESELETNAKAATRIETALTKANTEIKRAEDRLIELRGRTTDGSQR
ncbi:MAG: hypothetical protein ABIS59_01545, partial [Candidatus Saccharibacteria bacterium]